MKMEVAGFYDKLVITFAVNQTSLMKFIVNLMPKKCRVVKERDEMR